MHRITRLVKHPARTRKIATLVGRKASITTAFKGMSFHSDPYPYAKSNAFISRINEKLRSNKNIDDLGMTPLMQACCIGNLEAVKALLADSDSDDINKKINGVSALTLAIHYLHYDIVELFFKDPKFTFNRREISSAISTAMINEISSGWEPNPKVFKLQRLFDDYMMNLLSQ